jgi:uncharacterized iron-regulated protein
MMIVKSLYGMRLFQAIIPFLIFAACPSYAATTAKMDLDINISPEHSEVTGIATLTLRPGETHELIVKGIEIISVEANEIENDCTISRKRLQIGPYAAKTVTRIRFQKKLGGKQPDRAGNFISNDGINLLSQWHPMFRQPAIYNLSATLPKKLGAVSEADDTKKSDRGNSMEYRFIFPHPREGVTLVAGEYATFTDRYGNISLEAYFYDEDSALASKYIEKAGAYAEKYESILGPYPFRRFAVVENSMPTGFGMPTYTLLGRRVVRLPFIADTSLGHEFVHSWFGNSIYADRRGGNWSEGLTTFFSDYLYRQEEGHGLDYRHNILADYQSYVHDDNDMALEDFISRFDRASRAVGYGKGTMFFHMLKRETGFEAFDRGIRKFVRDYRFRSASWDDIRKTFEQESGKDLKPFFEQWLKRKDIPVIKITGASTREKADGATSLVLTIVQETDPPYILDNIPLILRTDAGDIVRQVSLHEAETVMELDVTNRVTSVVLDPDLDIMRKLAPEEFPPSLSVILGSRKKFAVNLEPERKIYQNAMEYLTHSGFMEIKKEELRHTTLKQGAFIFLGKPEGMLAMVAPRGADVAGGATFSVVTNPFNRDEAICFVTASEGEELDKAIPKLVHYGKYSELEFKDGQIRKKDIVKTRTGIMAEVEKPVPAIASSDISTIGGVIRKISGRDIIYIGEQHDRFEHHMVQLRIIEALYATDPDIAIGMEMFQYPFQEHIDSYMQGRINEHDFLEKTEYFKRWKFNYRLYRPVVEFCRKKGIPIIALNLPGEIARKVAREGLDALTPDERKMLPEKLDFSDAEYKKHLREIFRQHKGKLSDFDLFYQAQICWDETMAMRIGQYMKNNPGRKMVVMAGVGHVAWGRGIPDRVKKYGNFSSAILINSSGNPPEPGQGDFFLFPREMDAPFSAKIGVLIENADTSLVIKEVSPGSPAAKGGLLAGDRIVRLDDMPVANISDLKLELFFKEKGETALVTVIRKDNGREKEVTVKTGPLLPFRFSRVSPHGKMGNAVTHGKQEKKKK